MLSKTAKKALKPITRAVHFDFHTMPGIDNFGENFDSAEFAKILYDANVDYVNVFARCNIGFSYYPTKIGVPYPGMKGNMLGDIVRECHKKSIGVTAYLNTCLNHELMLRRPEWLLVDKEGRTYNHKEGGNAFRLLCYNTGYSDYYIEEIKEILAEDVDGIFCDCYEIPPCYCQNCISDMKKLGMDFTDDKAVAEFSKKVQADFMKKIRDAVPYDKRLFINGSKQWHGKDINSHFEVECLPSVWGYDYFAPNVAFARPLYDTVVYMNGKFQVCWGDFGGYKGKASLENDVFDALTQGVSVMMGDHLHPANLPDKDVYSDLGDIYARVKSYENWTLDAAFIPEIAILTNNKYIGNGGYGAARMLSELKYTYDIVWYHEDFSKYDLLIIPSKITFDEELSQKISAYLKAGGKVISAGSSALLPSEDSFALPEWSFDYVGKVYKDEKITTNICDAGFTTYFKLGYETNLANICYSEYETAIKMKVKEGSISLADEYDSYFESPGYDGRHFIYYTPPRKATGNSVMAINKEGNVAHVAFPIFSAFRKSAAAVYKDMIRTLIEKMMPRNLIRAKALPSTARVTLTGNDSYKLLHVKVTYPEIRAKLGVVEEHNVLPSGREIAVRGEFSEVVRLPDNLKLNSYVKDGYTYLTLPEIVGYDMFCLK